MLALLYKEIGSFLSSLLGYLIITVFLLAIGLYMWVFPGASNVLEAGYANIDTLFTMAPWVFMFLIPAITMRAFAEEKRTGTIEQLLTRPLTDLQIILAKFLAGFFLLIIALLPTLIYYLSVSYLGNPPDNVDTGGMWGSYIGLLFLGGGFVAIGIFASSLSENQIVSFIVGIFLCFFVYVGFESISALPVFSLIDNVIQDLGINEHYISLSKGVIDSRDVIYFLSLITVFLVSTRTVIESRKW